MEQMIVHSGRDIVRTGNSIQEVLAHGSWRPYSLLISTNAWRGPAAAWVLGGFSTCHAEFRQHCLARIAGSLLTAFPPYLVFCFNSCVVIKLFMCVLLLRSW